METETISQPVKDPQTELAELKTAVRMFCHTIEACAIIAQGTTSILQIQIESEPYKRMKSKI